MTDVFRLRTCVWRACERKGLPTSDERCPECGVPTEIATTFPVGGSLMHDGKPSATSPARPLIVTTNDVPLHEITSVHGDVFGLVVMSRDYFSNLGARFKTVVGGEIHGYTELLTRSRNEARERLWSSTLAVGGNAVVAFRFDCSEIGDIMSEVVAYGTAVTVRKIETAASASPD